MNHGNERTAIVTGAARRVGRVLAEGLIARGWTVVAHVHSPGDDVPPGALKVVADLCGEGSAAAIFEAARALPPVALLVNNAARFAWDGPGAFDGDEFDRHMSVNVSAPIRLMEALRAGHESGRDACVVNVLDSKIVAPNTDFLSYTLSKQALAAATDLYARALAPAGIRVNAVAPALMLRSSGQSEENYRSMHAMNPLGRGVEPIDVLDAVLYLAGADKVTGQIIVIDAGQRFMGLDRDVQFVVPR